MKKKQLTIGLSAAVGMLILILDGKTALNGAREGIEMCLRVVIPSLFPFFFFSNLITSSFWGIKLKIMRLPGSIFQIPEGAESLLIPAFWGGYPAGAKSISDAYQNGQLPKQEARRLLAFCNNPGPAFIFGMVSAAFTEKWVPWAIWGIQILGAVCAANWFHPTIQRAGISSVKSQSVSSAMNQSVTVMITVCGWVVFFRILLAFLDRWLFWLLPDFPRIIISGLLELSNGCCMLSSIPDFGLRFLIANVLLSAGGLCVTMQTMSAVSGVPTDLYFCGKAIQIIAGMLLSLLILSGKWHIGCIVCVIIPFVFRIKEKSCSISEKVRV